MSIVKALLSGVLPRARRAAAASTIVGAMALPLAAQAQTVDPLPADTPPVEAQPSTPARAVEQSGSPIGIASGQALMSEAESAISAQNYSLAAEKLVAARKALNEVSTYYQNLSGVFVGVDSRVNDGLRALALESAQVRDQASYQLAVVYRAQSRPDLAVPLLVEVVQSQQPTRPLGQQAYQQLYELGFVAVPYSAPGG